MYPSLELMQHYKNQVESFADFVSKVSEGLITHGNALNGGKKGDDDIICISESEFLRGTKASKLSRLRSLLVSKKRNRLNFF